MRSAWCPRRWRAREYGDTWTPLWGHVRFRPQVHVLCLLIAASLMNVHSSSQRIGKGNSSASSAGPANALCTACAAWLPAKVQRLLESGADPNAEGPDGVTPLFACFTTVNEDTAEEDRCLGHARKRHALENGHFEEYKRAQVETVKLLLRHGADPCLPSVGGDTPLLAAAASSSQLLWLLLEAAHAANRKGTSSSSSSSSSSSVSGGQPDAECDSGDRPCSPGAAADTIGSAGGSPSASVNSSSSSGGHTCSQESARTLQQHAGRLTQVVCIRGCSGALQLLMQQRLVPDLQEALHMCVTMLNAGPAAFLLANGADAAWQTESWSYLHVAVAGAHKMTLQGGVEGLAGRLLRTLDVLIQRGAPLEARSKNGWTAAAWAASYGLNTALIALHGAGADMQCVEDDTTGLLEVAWYKGHFHTLPLLVSMGVGWRAPPEENNTVRARASALKQNIYGSCLRAGVGVHYVRVNGLEDMAAAYEQLLDALCRLVAADATSSEEGGPAWLLATRVAVRRRTLEVLQDPLQLQQLVQRLEDSDWLEEARQDFGWRGLTMVDEASMASTVDAARFIKSGGVVVTPDSQALAAAAAAESKGQPAAVSDASSPADAGRSNGRLSSRPALELPPEAIGALDVLTRILIARDLASNLKLIIQQQHVQLLELLLQLGVPAARQSASNDSTAGLLALAVNMFDRNQGSDPDKATAIVQVLMQYGAQLDEPTKLQLAVKTRPCIQHALARGNTQLLRALLSCPAKMTPAAKDMLEHEILHLYSSGGLSNRWLALLSAGGLEVVPYLGDLVNLPAAAWSEAAKIEALGLLVELGWDINTMSGENNLLVTSADLAQWRLVTWLLEQGARCSTPVMKTRLLKGAAQTGDPEGLRRLLAAGILPQPEEVQQLAVQVAKHSKGRHTAAAMEKRLRLQIQSVERIQQRVLGSAGDSIAQASLQGTILIDAAAVAEAAAAELLAEEEEAAAATAAKAAKKAAKKQRKAAARSPVPESDPVAPLTQSTEPDAGMGGSTQVHEAAAGSSAGQLQSSSMVAQASTEPQEQAGIAGIADSHHPSTASPPSEGTAAMQEMVVMNDHLPGQVDGVSQAVASSSSSSRSSSTTGATLQRQTSTQQQQHRQQDEHAKEQCSPSAAPAAPAGVPVSGRSSEQRGCVAHAALPGVAGLFLELSERRRPASTAGPHTQPPPASSTPAGAAGSVPSSIGGSSWQPQDQSVSSSSSSRGGHGSGTGGDTAVPSGLAAGAPTPDIATSSSRAVTAATSSNLNRTENAAHEQPSSMAAAAAAPVLNLTAPPAPASSSVPQPSEGQPARRAVVRRPIRAGKECVVCMAARSCVLQHPCGHLCCCEACMELLLGKNQECPMCRTQVAEYWVL